MAKEFSDIWGEELMSPEMEILSDFEKQSTSGRVQNNALAAD